MAPPLGSPPDRLTSFTCAASQLMAAIPANTAFYSAPVTRSISTNRVFAGSRLASVSRPQAPAVLLVQADGLSCLRADSLAAVVANPPYVDAQDFPRLPDDIVRHEPRAALVPTEASVPAMYARLLDESRRALAPGGWLITEVGAGQAGMVAAMASVRGFGWVAVTPDLSGIERVVAARR
jgi:methylase of polypeptide subunit release factors